METKQLKNIKKVIQEYWIQISSEERRWILSHLIENKSLPKEHAIFKDDDLPYECVKTWLEETIAKEDWDMEYATEPCGC